MWSEFREWVGAAYYLCERSGVLDGGGGGGGGGGGLMSHVDFKKCQCRMSLSFNISPVPCQI